MRRFPFYSWIRLAFFCWLVLPQTQGARQLYVTYVDPFLHHHEHEIETLLARTTDNARATAVDAYYRALNYVRARLGLAPAPLPTRPPPRQSAPSYTQALLSRFSMPSAAPAGAASAAASGFSSLGLGGGAADLFSAVTSSITSAAGRRAEAGAGAGAGAAGTGAGAGAGDWLDVLGDNLFPSTVATASRAEKEQYLESQRDKLGKIMKAFDREQSRMERSEPGFGSGAGPAFDRRHFADGLAYGSGYEHEQAYLRKNRSENSFENIEHDDA